MSTETVNVARLRARVLWLAAKSRFALGAKTARFRRVEVGRMLELDFDNDPFGGIQAVLLALPENASPFWNGDEFRLCDPDQNKNTPDQETVTAVLDYWGEKTGATASLKKQRAGMVKSRLREGFTQDQLMMAIDALMGSEFHVSRGYTDIKYAISPEKLQRWLSMATQPDSGVQEFERVAKETMSRRRRI